MSFGLRINMCKKLCLVVRRYVGIICEKLTSNIVDTLKKKFLEIGVSQMVKANMYKSMTHFSFPLSFYIPIPYLFPMFFHLIVLVLIIHLCYLYLIYKIILNIS